MNVVAFFLHFLGIVCDIGILLVGIMGIFNAADPVGPSSGQVTLTWKTESDWTSWNSGKWRDFCANTNGPFANAQTSGVLW